MLEVNRNRASEEKQCWKRKTPLEKKLVIGIIIISILAFGFLLGLLFVKKKSTKECTTRECVEASAQLLNYIDTGADPCHDFFDFVCGTYVKNAVKESLTTPFSTANTKFKNEMKSLIVDPILKTDSNANVLLKKYYQECMNEEKIDSDNSTDLFTAEIEKIGGWPIVKGSNWNDSDASWVNVTIKLWELGFPFEPFFELGKHMTENDTVILKVTGSKLPPSHENLKQKLTSFMQGVAMTLEAHGDSFREVNEIVDFVWDLEKNWVKSANVEEKKVKDLKVDCPDVPWIYLLTALTGLNITDESEVASDLEDYCSFLQPVLGKTSKKIHIDYLIWTAVQNMSPYLSASIRFLYDTFKLPSTQDRHELCFDDADTRFKWVKETIYVRRKTDEKVRKELKEMTNNIVQEFLTLIEENDWMDEKAKKFALEKSKNIEAVVGCDDELYDEKQFDYVLGVDNFTFSSDKMIIMIQEKERKNHQHLVSQLYKESLPPWDLFFVRAVNPNAFFIQEYNLMIIPAPILQDVFFNIDFPHFMNYGSMGRIIGHELMHGLEKGARNTSGVGKDEDKFHDWWSKQTEQAYDKKVQCVIDQYEHFPYTKYKLNGTQTLDENISDFVGIDAAYKAYLKWVAKNGEEKRLAGLPYTPRQIYWMQANTFLCFKKLADDETDYEEPDEHSIPTFRINAGIKNSKYFAENFNCPAGAPMNPKEKCQVM